jgi:hypothetical protein
MKPFLAAAATSALALAGIASAAPALTEPRAYAAANSYEVGRGLWSHGDAAYATQSGWVVRFQRTKNDVVKTDSVYGGSMTETPMYIAKDSLHGFLVGSDSVCMIDWSNRPGKRGFCASAGMFGHGGFSGGLALDRYLTICSPSRKAFSFDTQSDSLRFIDSMAVGSSGGLLCQIEGEVLHTINQTGLKYVHERWMVNDFRVLEGVRDSSSADASFFWSSGQGAGLLSLDSLGVMRRLQWGALSTGKPVANMSRLMGRYKSASQSDSNIVVSNDSSVYVVRWPVSGDPFLVGKLGFESTVSGSPSVAVDGGYVWVRTPTGLLSLVIQDRTSGIEDRGARGPGSSMSTISVHRGGLVFDPSQSGKAAVLSPSGATLATLELKAGVSVSWKSNRTGIHLVRMADKTIPVLIP